KETALGLVHAWDQAALTMGHFGDVTQAIMNEIWLKGQDTAKKIAEAFLGMVDSINTSLAKALTGGKAESLKQIFQGFAEKVVKAELEKIEASVVEKVFGVGLTAKPDGSPAKPFSVILTNHAQVAAAHAAEGSKGVGGIFGTLFGGLLGRITGKITGRGGTEDRP